MRKIRYLLLLGCMVVINGIFAQIPNGYYSTIANLTGEDLKTELHQIIKNHIEFPYTSSNTDVWDILKETDKDTINPDNVILFYTGWSVNAAQEYNNGNGWTREHVWAKSHGDFGTTMGAGTDAHHLRPADNTVNSARNNKDFDNGGSLYVDGGGATECYTDNDSWEPRDVVKGDVARMLFYMAVRYEGDISGEPDLELVDLVNTYDQNESGKGYHGKLSTLLDWHKQDPVDSFEMNRNDAIYSYQQNRNPFIDHPEYVNLIWGDFTNTTLTDIKEITLYPNPTMDFIIIDSPYQNEFSGEILNINGETVLQLKVLGKIKVDIAKLRQGVYILKIKNEKEIFLRKFMVSNFM